MFKRLALIGVALFVLAAGSLSHVSGPIAVADDRCCATCTGAADCKACKNCKSCKHCKAGGTCGACKKPSELE